MNQVTIFEYEREMGDGGLASILSFWRLSRGISVSGILERADTSLAVKLYGVQMPVHR